MRDERTTEALFFCLRDERRRGENMSGITREATSPTVGNPEELDKLLSADQAPAQPETETQEEEQSENLGTGTEEAEQEANDDEGPAAEEEAAEEEAAEEETELSIDENDRDYSDAAYKKAADHYARTKKIELDPQDPAHRALLKEIMDRGEALNRQRQEAERQPDKAATGEGGARPGEYSRPAPSAEEIRVFTENAAKVAKARLIPEIAMHVTTSYVKALNPGHDFDEEPISQEVANNFTAALSEFFWMQLEDALPVLLGQSRQSLSADPVFGQVEAQTIGAQAFERMDHMKGKDGRPLYPDLEEMVESGALKKALDANPQIAKMKAGDGRNPIANQLLRFRTAYALARKTAPGRTSAGKPGVRGGTRQVLSDITGGGGSKFSQALRRDGRKA